MCIIIVEEVVCLFPMFSLARCPHHLVVNILSVFDMPDKQVAIFNNRPSEEILRCDSTHSVYLGFDIEFGLSNTSR